MSMVSGDKLNEIYQNGVRPNSNTYVVCSTAGNTATKTVTSTGFALTSGKHITVKFTNENTAKNLKLKVNTLGAKSLLYRGEDIGEQPIAANSILEFVYNGTAFECIGGMGDSGKILSWAAYQALTPAEQAKGDYYIYDKGSVGGVVDSTLDTSSGNAIANSAVATAINGINSDLSELNCGRGYAEVTADGVKTISTLLNELYPLVDKSKISGLSYFEKMERRYNLQAIQPSYIVCSFVTVNPGFILTETMTLTESTSTYKSASTVANSTTFTDNSSVVLTSGTKLRLFY